MQEKTKPFHEVEATLFARVEEAIRLAAEEAGPEFRALGLRRSAHDYFADGVLRHLFVRLSGGDPDTNMGGDPEIAWTMLYAGRNVARHWERERGGPAALRRRKERREDIETDKRERRELALSAQRFAMNTVIRALLDHARATDPQIDERMQAAIDAHLAELGSVSETDREFARAARRAMSVIARLPD